MLKGSHVNASVTALSNLSHASVTPTKGISHSYSVPDVYVYFDVVLAGYFEAFCTNMISMKICMIPEINQINLGAQWLSQNLKGLEIHS